VQTVDNLALSSAWISPSKDDESGKHPDEMGNMATAFPIAVLLSCVLASAATGSHNEPATVGAGKLGRQVNLFIGTGGNPYVCGNVSPGAALPFAMVRLGPDTVARSGKRATNSSGYYFHDDRIVGFSHTRLSGTGAWDGGNFLVLPCTESRPPVGDHRRFEVPFDHKDEVAFPGYYAVTLPESGIKAELTATRRVGVHRYTFAQNAKPRILVDATSVLGRGKSKEGQIRVLADANEVEGSVRTFGTFSARYGGIKVYFVARFSQGFAAMGTWQGDSFSRDRLTVAGDDVGVDLTFHTNSPRPIVELKLAISYVSVQNARANLDVEVGAAGFDKVLGKAVGEWEDKLAQIRIVGGTEKQQTIFYTALYHSLLMPSVFNDVNGDYLGFDGLLHRASESCFYTDMSLWDTFRTTHPLFTLIAPTEQRDMMVSLIEIAKQGGYLPRWPSGNGYTNSMFGTPADIVVAEAYLKGIRDFDVEAAYQAMRKTALGPTRDSRFSGRAGIEDYLKFHYCPFDRMRQSVARTLDYCYADHAIARLAEALGRREDLALFNEHAQYYRKLWNPKTQYFQPLDSRGKFFEDFRPELLTYHDLTGKYTNAYVEGSALQWRWAVPFDAHGLVSLFKSPAYFVGELDQFFSKSIPAVGALPNAYYWHGNQPDLYAAFLFNAAGRPDLTQKWVRWILETKYGNRENGLDGNDDGGSLSAWYVFGSIGLFPTAGTDRYELASPVWQRAELNVGGRRLSIVADNFATDHVYVQKVLLNGTPLNRRWLRHGEIARGGVLQFEMGSKPAPY
jgi:predicted alpha-1,2-mannosidase